MKRLESFDSLCKSSLMKRRTGRVAGEVRDRDGRAAGEVKE